MGTKYREYAIKEYHEFIEIMLRYSGTIQEIAKKCKKSYDETYQYMKETGLLDKYQRRLNKKKKARKLVKEVQHWPPRMRKLKVFPSRPPPTE